MQAQSANNTLQDRVILVTGAGDGIGRMASINFAAQGATVILLGRTTRKLEAVYDEIEEAGYPQPAIYPMNLEGASDKDYIELAERLDEAFGCLHGLLHNAAVLGDLTPMTQYDLTQWLKIIHVNLNAPFMLTQACLPLLKKADSASVAFTTDDATRAYWGAYGVSKAAANGMMKILADELETNTQVRVNSINPGPTRTTLRAKAFPAETEDATVLPETIMPHYLALMEPDNQRHGEIINCQETA
ncbi:MAG: YciK family oxidoreductase [Pseudomonadota bacterium]